MFPGPDSPRKTQEFLGESVMSKKLEGKLAVVTGESKGIGAEIARHLAAEGAKVVVNYASSRAGADRVVADITAKGGKAVAVQADVARPDDVKKLFARSKEAFGPVDVLVNNAGVYEFSPLENVTPEHFHKQFDLNVLGLILATQEAAKQFGDRGGAVVNVSSVAAAAALPTASVYSATKAAVDAVTRSLAAELGARKVRVNSVNPARCSTCPAGTGNRLPHTRPHTSRPPGGRFYSGAFRWQAKEWRP
jgi:3-oxoacyl-[acyl-carrier protein] reductase